MGEKQSSSFTTAFLPGLILGLIVGALAGAFVPTLLTERHTPSPTTTNTAAPAPGDHIAPPRDGIMPAEPDSSEQTPGDDDTGTGGEPSEDDSTPDGNG